MGRNAMRLCHAEGRRAVYSRRHTGSLPRTLSPLQSAAHGCFWRTTQNCDVQNPEIYFAQSGSNISEHGRAKRLKRFALPVSTNVHTKWVAAATHFASPIGNDQPLRTDVITLS